jgi:hydroxymethylbilane synthase
VRRLRIGTRRSRLALVQAEIVRDSLRGAGADAVLVPMTTSGDEGAPASSSPSGLKGLWIDTIIDALRAGEIDLAVHSAKDLPAEDDPDVVLGAIPERADPRDVLVLRNEGDLQAGMVVGTSSLRRGAQIRAAFAGVDIAPLRGNVDTRLRKLSDGDVDATILAAAGLVRLGIEPAHTRALSIEQMVPAPGQGCLAVQCRSEDRELRALLTQLDHRISRMSLEAERELTRRLGGGCSLPLGAIAAARGDVLRLAAVVAAPDGGRVMHAAAESEDPMRAAAIVADRLLAGGADRILDEVRAE